MLAFTVKACVNRVWWQLSLKTVRQPKKISPCRFRPVTTLPGGIRTDSISDLCKRHWDTGVADGVGLTDITYLRTREVGVPVCDACSHKVISTAMTTDLMEEALRRGRILRSSAPGKVFIIRIAGLNSLPTRCTSAARNSSWTSPWDVQACAGIMR
jgi:hypothetical protein